MVVEQQDTGLYISLSGLEHAFYACYLYRNESGPIDPPIDPVPPKSSLYSTSVIPNWALSNFETYSNNLSLGTATGTGMYKPIELPIDSYIEHPSSSGIAFASPNSIYSNPLYDIDYDEQTNKWYEREIAMVQEGGPGGIVDYAVFEIDGSCLSAFAYPEGSVQGSHEFIVFAYKLNHNKFYYMY